jgi:hypothetical protein
MSAHGGRAQHRPHLRPRLEELALAGAGVDPQHLADLFVCVPFHVVQDQHAPHPFRQPFHRPLQLHPQQRVAGASANGVAVVDHRLAPGLALAAAAAVERAVDGHAVQPGGELRLAPEGGERADHADPRLLRPVLRQGVVARHTPHHGEHAGCVSLVQRADGAAVAATG